MTSVSTSVFNTACTVSGLHSSISQKMHSFSYRLTKDGWQKCSEKVPGEKGPFFFLCASVPKNGWKVYFILLWKIIEFPFQWYASSLCIIFFMPNNLDLLAKNKCWMNQKAQIPQCPVPYPTMRHFVKTGMHIAVAIWCIVGYLSDALWQMWDGSINS